MKRRKLDGLMYENPRVDAFLAELLPLMERHRLILRQYDESDDYDVEEWSPEHEAEAVRNAGDATFDGLESAPRTNTITETAPDGSTVKRTFRVPGFDWKLKE